MSYTKDLNEYVDNELYAELTRRTSLRKKGLCDYCEKSVNTPPCKFPDRHKQAEIEYNEYQLRVNAF